MYYLPFVLLKKIFWNIVHVKCSTKRDYRDESWKHITFHRSTCGAMFFTMFCMDRVEGGKINRKVREREKKKKYGTKISRRTGYLSFSPRTKGRYYPFDLKLDRWKAFVVAPCTRFTMQKTIFDYVNRYSVALCTGKARHIVMQDVNVIYIGLKRRYKFHGDP